MYISNSCYIQQSLVHVQIGAIICFCSARSMPYNIHSYEHLLLDSTRISVEETWKLYRTQYELLNRTFEGHWIGQSGSNKWAARSSDLTPWGKLKEQVYREKPTTTVDMQARIKRTCSVINTTEICQAVSSVLQLFRLYLSVQGRHFEHLK